MLLHEYGNNAALQHQRAMEKRPSNLSFSIENILYGRSSKTSEARGRTVECHAEGCAMNFEFPCTVRGCVQECRCMELCVSERCPNGITAEKHRRRFELADCEGLYDYSMAGIAV